MPEHALTGCRPVPLAGYLKALGVLRLLGEQADPGARGAWRAGGFEIRTRLDKSALERFFLLEYQPTPIVAPWNGGSGFYSGDNRVAIRRIAGSTTVRFDTYRRVIDAAARVVSELGITEKVSVDDKQLLLESCRAGLPDEALPWLDAAYLLTHGVAKYPPLLGTGGNDGRLEFTNNFMQRVLDLVDEGTGKPTPAAAGLLGAALFDEQTDQLTGGAIGQFLPSGAGGANASTGFDGDALFNPWDFVLMLEGAAMFAVAAVRRLAHEAGGALSFPFTVRASGVGYPTAADADEQASRGEIWLPLWRRLATAAEVRAILSEGRTRIAGRTARNGVDFARAVATLGVDRGIDSFQRYGFHLRNGLAYLATPLEEFRVRVEPKARLLDQIDAWLRHFRHAAAGDRAPAAVRWALRGLEHSIVDLSRRGGLDRVQRVLIALGTCERTMARSLRWAVEQRLPPLPALSPTWLTEGQDASSEHRLAASLASVFGDFGKRVVPLRRHFEPVQTRVVNGRLAVDWDESAGRDVAWIEGDLPAALNAVLARRLMLCRQARVEAFPDRGHVTASLGDVSAFVNRSTDDARITDLLWAWLLIDWPGVDGRLIPVPTEDDGQPHALYGVMKLCLAGPSWAGHPIPVVPEIHRLAAAGQGAEASRVAVRRLRASGLPTAVSVVHADSGLARRAAAALLFPLSRSAMFALGRTVLRQASHSGETTQ